MFDRIVEEVELKPGDVDKIAERVSEILKSYYGSNKAYFRERVGMWVIEKIKEGGWESSGITEALVKKINDLQLKGGRNG